MIVPYSPRHILGLEFDSRKEREAAIAAGNDLARINTAALKPGAPARAEIRTIVSDNNTPLAVVGIGEVAKGTVEVFSITSDKAKARARFTFYKDLRVLIAQARVRFPNATIQTLGKFSARLQRHFALLGFVYDRQAPIPDMGIWKLLGLAAVTFAVDHFLSPFCVDKNLYFADPITLGVIAGTSLLVAGSEGGMAVANYSAAQGAATAQKNLAQNQADILKQQQAANAELVAGQATTGSTFGFAAGAAPAPDAAGNGTGFGTGAKAGGSPNAPTSGRAQITGM